MSEVLKKLGASILAGRAMHAYLLTGADTELTGNAARNIASLMLYGRRDMERLVNDPDFMEYGGAVSIGDFRDVIRPELYRETFGGNGRVVVFKLANQLSAMVQNAMLKVLEEPPENTRFILTGNEYGILPTIRSRCMIIRCSVSDNAEIEASLLERGASPDEARSCTEMSGGVTARALRLYEDEGFRELRSGAVGAFTAALCAAPDFKWTKVKRDRNDWLEANEMLLLACHDMLKLKLGLGPEYFRDTAAELKKVCSHFTIGDISCIIDKLTENAQRLSTNASGGAAFDRLFACLAMIGLAAIKNKNN
ncbi:MAG: hypothetical protein K6G56_06665 [Clostridiales bacterium]|nr:hypothetical protein [Clostridiales bacterium]